MLQLLNCLCHSVAAMIAVVARADLQELNQVEKAGYGSDVQLEIGVMQHS